MTSKLIIDACSWTTESLFHGTDIANMLGLSNPISRCANRTWLMAAATLAHPKPRIFFQYRLYFRPSYSFFETYSSHNIETATYVGMIVNTPSL